MQNILAAIFEVESEGYQAISTISKKPVTENAAVLQMALVKRDGQNLSVLEHFDSGINTSDDMLVGGLVGSLLGVLGGPIGVLLMGSYGLLAGSIIDTGDVIYNTSLMEAVANKLHDGSVALIALTDETNEADLDDVLSAFQAEILRFDAAQIAAQVEEAELLQQEMARQARQQLRSEKKADFQKKVEEKRAKISEQFDDFKSKFKASEA